VDDRDRKDFLSTLGEVCEKCGFVVHSYVLMPNHYHLLLETPVGNLVNGMKWFQGTYTARFNARHRLSGHLFAGRYKAVLVDRGDDSYGRVVSDYIHLNPVRAKIVNGQNPRLRGFPWSSFPSFCGEGKLAGWLSAAEVYSWHHFDWQRASDRKAYGLYLQRRAEQSWAPPIGRETRELGRDLKQLRTGWVLGSEAFRDQVNDLLERVVGRSKRESYTGEEVRHHDEAAAQELLHRGLRALDIELATVRLLPQNEPRKQALAWLIRSRTVVGSDWITQNLDMGHRSNVSRAVSAFRRANHGKTKRLKRIMHLCKD
jgi:REP element-mobilizing transposase RayT